MILLFPFVLSSYPKYDMTDGRDLSPIDQSSKYPSFRDLRRRHLELEIGARFARDDTRRLTSSWRIWHEALVCSLYLRSRDRG